MSAPNIPWEAIAGVMKELAPALLPAVAQGLRAQGFEIPRDPAEVRTKARSKFEARVKERFPKR